MKRTTLQLFSTLFLLTTLSLTSNAQPLFTKDYGFGTCIKVLPADQQNVLALGQHETRPVSLIRCQLMKLNSSGDTLWRKFFGSGISTGQSMIKVGNVYWVLLNNYFNGFQISQLVQVNEQGDSLKGFYLPQLNGLYREASDLTLSDNGHLMITGSLTGPQQIKKGFICEADQNGNLLMTKTINHIEQEDLVCNRIIKHTNGSFYLLGSKMVYDNNQIKNKNLLVVKCNNQGDTIWSLVIGGSKDDKPNVIKQIPGSNDIIIGATSKSFATDWMEDYYLIRMNENGTVIRSKVIGQAYFDRLGDITFDVDGNIVLTGSSSRGSSAGTSAEDMVLMKLNNQFDSISTQYVNGYNLQDAGLSIIATADSSWLIGGFISEGNSIVYSNKFALVKIKDQKAIYNSTNENVKEQPLEIYPNPVKEFLYIHKPDDKEINLTITDMKGKRVLTQTIRERLTAIPTNEFNGGIYFIRYETQDKVYTHKMVVR